MGLLDSIKKTASNAVNSVTGNSTPSKQQSTQSIQTSTPNQEVQPTVAQSQSQVTSPSQQEQKIQPTSNTSPENSFLGKPFSGSGAGPLLKPTRFYSDHLQFGEEKISYKDLSEITIVHMPSSMTNGTAQVLHKSARKTLTMTFRDPRGFLLASEYANDKIAEANGNYVPRKCAIYNSSGEKLILFDDYISIKRLGQGLSGMMGQSNNSENILISKISEIKVVNGSQLSINYTNDSGATSQCIYACSPSNTGTLEKIVSYVQTYTPDSQENEIFHYLEKHLA